MVVYTLVSTLAFFQLALASLYPTHPVGNSVFVAGTVERVTWLDTLTRPRLLDIGPLTISLCNPSSLNCTLLAEKVSPTSRAYSIFIPANFTTPAQCVLIFKTAYPPMRFWSANFTVNPPMTDTIASYEPQLDDVNNTNTNHLLTLVLPSTTLVTAISPATQVPAATTITAGPPPKDGGGTGLNHVGAPNTGNLRKGSNLQKARLGILCVLWPAVVGVSLAS
ncbi:hypothetical protein C8F01DRAFT_498494 [Mycena amicta]|nr:hypothetical protein C8F01DRAFT_498494 [Mycena amicta]